MIRINSNLLTDFVSRIFQAAGTPEKDAGQVARSLVSSNLAGHDSHGVIRVPRYLHYISLGNLDPTAQPVINQEIGAITRIDAQHGFGQVACHYAMSVSNEKARQFGLAATTLVHSNHVGRLGEWVHMAAEENLIGLAFCNCGRTPGWVTPYGGAGKLLGTNPVAAAIPLAGRPPFLLDFATSIRAEGKVKVALNSGKALPEGWILDAQGQPSTNPKDLYDGGMLLPAGDYKGYSLSLLAELLGGILSGQGTPGVPGQQRFRNGVTFIVLTIEAFRPQTEFLDEAELLAAKVKSMPLAPGFEEILLPGKPEARTAEQRRQNGIPLDRQTWNDLVAAAEKFGIAYPQVQALNSGSSR